MNLLPATYMHPLQTIQFNSTWHLLFPESQRDSDSQPRVAPTVLPWVTVARGKQPQRGCGPSGGGRYPGHNPVGVDIMTHPLPRVGAERQPWALGHNPFGIAKPVVYLLHKLHVRCRPRWRAPKSSSGLKVSRAKLSPDPGRRPWPAAVNISRTVRV